MAYSELIKNFGKIRSYMRDFYVFGFRGRDEFSAKSARIYDDESRRVKSWLEGYIDSYYDETGKKVFLSIDSRSVPRNPLYTAFKAKSFTDWDITLHFFLLDILRSGPASVNDCLEKITGEYLRDFSAEFPDEGTIRNKLREYEKMGILVSRKEGRTLTYALAEYFKELPEWKDAVDFGSEAMPLGVIGSYFPREGESAFRFKHQYFLGATDSEVLYDLCLCMTEHRKTEVTCVTRKKKEERKQEILPVRFYFSTRTGRQYVLGYSYPSRRFLFFRLDSILKVKALEAEEEPERYEALWQAFDRHLWGVGLGQHTLDHLEMVIHAEPGEDFIPNRLEREKRHGRVEQVDETTWKFTADVYDASEMLPWIRTFIGRIDRLECSNPGVTRVFREDLEAMRRLYGGDP